MGYRPQGPQELDMTEVTLHTYMRQMNRRKSYKSLLTCIHSERPRSEYLSKMAKTLTLKTILRDKRGCWEKWFGILRGRKQLTWR